MTEKNSSFVKESLQAVRDQIDIILGSSNEKDNKTQSNPQKVSNSKKDINLCPDWGDVNPFLGKDQTFTSTTEISDTEDYPFPSPRLENKNLSFLDAIASGDVFTKDYN